MRFLAPLIGTPVGTRLFVVTQPFVFGLDSLNDRDRMTVPAGFVSDGASIPWPFRLAYPQYGPWHKAAVVHDYGYIVQERSRFDVDWIFYLAMGVAGVRPSARWLFHQAVRQFGQQAWEKNARLRALNPRYRLVDLAEPGWWHGIEKKPLMAA
jgi:hypothetical protein